MLSRWELVERQSFSVYVFPKFPLLLHTRSWEQTSFVLCNFIMQHMCVCGKCVNMALVIFYPTARCRHTYTHTHTFPCKQSCLKVSGFHRLKYFFFLIFIFFPFVSQFLGYFSSLFFTHCSLNWGFHKFSMPEP